MLPCLNLSTKVCLLHLALANFLPASVPLKWHGCRHAGSQSFAGFWADSIASTHFCVTEEQVIK